jgi:toxin YoeB
MTPSGHRSSQPRNPRSLVVEPECLEDLRWWTDTNRKTALRVFDLIEAVMRDPFSGIGKPEHLKQMGANIWARRVTGEDRLVYLVRDDNVHLLQARFHY